MMTVKDEDFSLQDGMKLEAKDAECQAAG